MNKNDLVHTLAQKLGDRSTAQKALNALLDTIAHSLRSGEKVILSGIGSFHPKIRKTQQRHNPNTMEPILVPARRVVRFVQSPELFKK